jgi:hypothetical protein
MVCPYNDNSTVLLVASDLVESWPQGRALEFQHDLFKKNTICVSQLVK